MDRKKEETALNLEAEQPSTLFDFRAASDLYSMVLSSGIDVEMFARYFVKSAVLDAIEAIANGDPMPVIKQDTVFLTDYNYFIARLSGWARNSQIATAFSIGGREQKAEALSSGFAFVTYLSMVYKMLSPQTLVRMFVKGKTSSGSNLFQGFYSPLIYSVNGRAVQYNAVSLSSFFLSKIFENTGDKEVYERFEEFASNENIKCLGKGLTVCKKWWQENGGKAVYYA